MLAIVVPYYKLAYFEDTIRSLSAQTDKRFKVYIGDDASPEDCSWLLEKYRGTFNFVYERFDENLGSASLVKQWDRCIELTADEKWIMILGDDDFVAPNLVSSFYKHVENFTNHANVLRFAKQIIFEKTKSISDIQSHQVWEDASTSYYNRLIGITTSSLSEYMFTREVYNKYKFYDFPLAWHSDDRAWLEFTDYKPIYTINEAIVTVRSSFINIGGKSDNRAIKNLAVLSFFRFLVNEKLSLFNKIQAIRILREYENSIKRVRAINIYDRVELLPFYMKNFDAKVFISFVKRSVKTIFSGSTWTRKHVSNL